jgi:hypothetical protein
MQNADAVEASKRNPTRASADKTITSQTGRLHAGFIVSAKVSGGMLVILRKLVQLYIFVQSLNFLTGVMTHCHHDLWHIAIGVNRS